MEGFPSEEIGSLSPITLATVINIWRKNDVMRVTAQTKRRKRACSLSKRPERKMRLERFPSGEQGKSEAYFAALPERGSLQNPKGLHLIGNKRG